MSKITIRDVAAKAGVSVSTVSRVINGNYPVSEKAKKKVKKAIKELDFTPNLLAKALSTDRTNTVSIIVPTIENAFFAEVIKGIGEVLDKHGYTFFLGISDGDYEKEQELMEKSRQRKVDGFIVIDGTVQNIENHYFEKFDNIVLINNDINAKCNVVCTSTSEIFEGAISKLVSDGFENIVFIKGENSYSYIVKEKIFDSFKFPATVKTSKITVKGGNDIQTVNETLVVMQNFLVKGNNYGVIACNDLMGVATVMAGVEKGIEIPKELSVIGIDNTIYSKIICPALTTIDHNMYQLGKIGANRLIELIASVEKIKQKIFINSNFIERNSTL